METELEKAFYGFYGAIQTALETVTESHKEKIEDSLCDYHKPLEAEGFFESETIPDWQGFFLATELGPITKRQEAALTSVGEALRDFVQAEESPEAESKLSEAVTENETALKQAGFSVFIPKGKGFKEVK